MAVGDVVSGISAANTILNFQPAAGVECVITSVHTLSTARGIKITNGTSTSGRSGDATSQPLLNCKVFINNTNYLELEADGGGAHSAYTGLQIK